MKKITIAIDGHSSCGKSTFAKAIAKRLGYLFIDTGSMYRAVTLHALNMGYINDKSIDQAAIEMSLESLSLAFEFNQASGKSEVVLDGQNVESQIRGLQVSSYVSQVSAIAAVRHFLVAMQQKMGQSGGVVMDGRDIGTVVFPNAELKIYMTASVDVRAQRRYDELTAKGESVSLEDIKTNIESRDYNDENRAESPLKRADDALLLDNSNMSVEQQMEWFDQKLATLI